MDKKERIIKTPITGINCNLDQRSDITTSIAPWLSVKDAHKALQFYKAAFDAIETDRLDTPDDLIVRLSIQGAEFWISGNSAGNTGDDKKFPLGGDSLRLVLIVNNPEGIFTKALAAGASQIFPVGYDHGWRLGRIADPFGLHWEIGHPLS